MLVGTWKSVCYSTTTGAGLAVFTKRVRTIAKTNATTLASSTVLDSVFSDAACTNNIGSWSPNAATGLKYVLGAKVPFLGANADTYVSTNDAGSTFAGYAVVDGNKMYLVDTTPGSAAPTGWGIYSPYTKQ
jgi:hypothetical protein